MPVHTTSHLRSGDAAPAPFEELTRAVFAASDLVEELVLMPAGVRIASSHETDPEVFDEILEAVHRFVSTSETPYR